jgi:uncharacterized membrane protein YqhA
MTEQDRDSVFGPPPLRAEETTIARRVFATTRYFAIFAVLGSFLASATLYLYGALVVISVIWDTITEFHITVDGAKHLQVVFIEVTDVFLLGTVLFIVSFGLYQLFIQPDLPVPAWLRIDNLDQLTERLIEVVSVLLSVTFLAFAVDKLREATLVEVGVSVALVIAALGLLSFVSHRHSARRHSSHGE